MTEPRIGWLHMRKVQGLQCIVVRTDRLRLEPVLAAPVVRTAHFVQEVILREDACLVVSYAGCSVERIKQNIFMSLKAYLKPPEAEK